MVVPKFIESALNNENIVIHGDGSQSRSFTWVDDVVSYLIKLAEIKAYGEVFNIGQTEEITIKDLAELIIEKTSSKSKIIYKTHEEIFGKAFDDPKRRTPGIEKIIKFTGIEPSKNIDFMIEKENAKRKHTQELKAKIDSKKDMEDSNNGVTAQDEKPAEIPVLSKSLE